MYVNNFIPIAEVIILLKRVYGGKYLRGFMLSLFFVIVSFSLVEAEASKAGSNVTILINGQKVSSEVMPCIENGRVLVPFRAVFEPMGGIVQWKAGQKMVVARRGLLDLRIRVGDQNGRLGNKNIKLDVPAQIVQGRTLVPLRFISESLFLAQVKWDHTTKTVYISTASENDLEPLISAFNRTVSGKTPGEIVDVGHLELMSVPEIVPDKKSHPESPVTLLFSDSPEYVDRPGVTYRGKGQGQVRLVYYHIPHFSAPAFMALVAHNPGQENAKIHIKRQLHGDKNSNRKLWQELGADVTLNYLQQMSNSENLTYDVPAGSAVLLNAESAQYRSGELMYGITDLYTDQEVEFTFMVMSNNDKIDAQSISKSPVLPKDDRHDRGTFWGGDQLIEVSLGHEIAGFLIGDGFSDPALLGKDESTGQNAQLLGNYGVYYHVRAQFSHPTILLFVPLGGDLFSGGIAAPQGLFSLSRVPTFAKAIYLGEFDQGDQAEWRFMPPAGSNLPVLIIAVPVSS
jgi:hypothetical protein